MTVIPASRRAWARSCVWRIREPGHFLEQNRASVLSFAVSRLPSEYLFVRTRAGTAQAVRANVASRVEDKPPTHSNLSFFQLAALSVRTQAVLDIVIDYEISLLFREPVVPRQHV